MRRNTKSSETRQRIGDKVSTLLASVKLRHTRQRSNILGMLVEKHGPFSAQEIQAHIGREACDPVTVYRVLESFENGHSAGSRCDFPGFRSRQRAWEKHVSKYLFGGMPSSRRIVDCLVVRSSVKV